MYCACKDMILDVNDDDDDENVGFIPVWII